MPNAVIFDLDGTLTKTNRLHLKNLQECFLEVFGARISGKEILPLFGESAEEIAKDLLPKHSIKPKLEDLKKFIALKNRLFLQKAVGKRFFPKKTINFLKFLRKKGLKLAIASGTTRKMLNACVKSKERKLFDVLVCADDVRHSKPNPQLLLKALEKLKVKKQDAIYLGDSLVDAQAAKNSGLKFIGVLSGIASARQFRKEGAIAVLEKVHDLKKLFS